MDEKNGTIISAYALRNIILYQLKEMTANYKILCGCEFWRSSKSIHYKLLTWSYNYLKKIKYQGHNYHNR